MRVISEQFTNLSFNDDEIAFLEQLADNTKSFDFLIILFGVADTLGQPLSLDDLPTVLTDKIMTITAPTWVDAVNGAKNIVAGEASQSVQLFILGHFPGLMGKRPQLANMHFFTDLAQQYTNMLNP